jgi:hypothetical protein
VNRPIIEALAISIPRIEAAVIGHFQAPRPQADKDRIEIPQRSEP